MLKKLWEWITGAAGKIKNALSFGKDIANEIKSVADNPLLDIIVKLTPTGLDDTALAAFRTFMHELITELNWADSKLDNTEPKAKAIILHSLSAGAAYWKALSDGVDLNLQTTLSTPQLVYDVSKVNLNA